MGMSEDFTARLDDVLAELVGIEESETVEETTVEQSDVTEPADDGNVEEVQDGDDETTDEPVDSDEDASDDEDDSEEEATEVIDLDPDAVVRIDGKEVKVSEALELKAAFTKKTQALAEERKAFEEEIEESRGRLDYVSQLEQLWETDPAQVIVGFAAGASDPEDLLAEAVVALAENGSADGNLAVVKSLIALAANDLLSEELAAQIGFTDEVVDRIKSQVKTEQRVVKVERRLAAEEKRMAAQQEQSAYEAEVARHLAELNSQWDRIVQANPEVSSLSEAERHELKIQLVTYAQDNEGVPLHVAYDALEAKRLRGLSAQRAAEAAARKKKSQSSRVVSKPSASGPSPSARQKGDWDAAIAEAMSELEARKRAN
jgi:hypothetical protein